MGAKSSHWEKLRSEVSIDVNPHNMVLNNYRYREQHHDKLTRTNTFMQQARSGIYKEYIKEVYKVIIKCRAVEQFTPSIRRAKAFFHTAAWDSEI